MIAVIYVGQVESIHRMSAQCKSPETDGNIQFIIVKQTSDIRGGNYGFLWSFGMKVALSLPCTPNNIFLVDRVDGVAFSSWVISDLVITDRYVQMHKDVARKYYPLNCTRWEKERGKTRMETYLESRSKMPRYYVNKHYRNDAGQHSIDAYEIDFVRIGDPVLYRFVCPRITWRTTTVPHTVPSPGPAPELSKSCWGLLNDNVEDYPWAVKVYGIPLFYEWGPVLADIRGGSGILFYGLDMKQVTRSGDHYFATPTTKKWRSTISHFVSKPSVCTVTYLHTDETINYRSQFANEERVVFARDMSSIFVIGLEKESVDFAIFGTGDFFDNLETGLRILKVDGDMVITWQDHLFDIVQVLMSLFKMSRLAEINGVNYFVGIGFNGVKPIQLAQILSRMQIEVEYNHVYTSSFFDDLVRARLGSAPKEHPVEDVMQFSIRFLRKNSLPINERYKRMLSHQQSSTTQSIANPQVLVA